MSSINWQIPMGIALWCLGTAEAGLLGALFTYNMVWDTHLAIFFAWMGLLSFGITLAMKLSAIRTLIGIAILTTLSSIFGVAVLHEAGPLAWAVATSWFATAAGGSLLASGIR
ncbi:MAG: hypothetical protein JSS86_07925 [Cyanobacteria bacterium SZAS LIN-2]|nr:hypothetical protein [Cyanobacteria bacterium SZAS LIN-3]MBS1996221.1 hypothetical protein [Cyanobacteria bacterium SZAS LIN-2]